MDAPQVCIDGVFIETFDILRVAVVRVAGLDQFLVALFRLGARADDHDEALAID